MTQPPLPSRTGCIVVGAGFAGAAAAYGLARRGRAHVLVLEREAVAGVHASGRNAAMAFSFISDPTIRALARRGRAFLAQPPTDFPFPLVNRWTGSVAVAGGTEAAALEALAAAMRVEGIDVREWSADELRERLPVYGPRAGERAFHCPDDGVIDVDALLQGFLRTVRRQGGQVRFRCEAQSLLIEAGRVRGVQTSEGLVRAEAVVLAGGPWANHLAVSAGLAPLPLAPHRRHLGLVVETRVPPDPSWPLCWHRSEGFYFRPESGGLLVSACDKEPMAPCDVGTDPAQVERLAERVLALLPGAAGARIRRVWAGLRTLTPDDRFVVGPDPRVEGLHWVAGLAGHGMTTSAAVGEVLAELLVTGQAHGVDASSLAPARFLA